MPIARAATYDDLQALLELFRLAEVGPGGESVEQAHHTWRQMLDQEGTSVFVSEVDGKIAATCTLITAPNLLRQGSRHAFIENMVTEPSLKGRGHTRAVIDAALAKAWTMDCRQVLLQRGRDDPRAHRFYEHCGFEAGWYTAYVARRTG